MGDKDADKWEPEGEAIKLADGDDEDEDDDDDNDDDVEEEEDDGVSESKTSSGLAILVRLRRRVGTIFTTTPGRESIVLPGESSIDPLSPFVGLVSLIDVLPSSNVLLSAWFVVLLVEAAEGVVVVAAVVVAVVEEVGVVLVLVSLDNKSLTSLTLSSPPILPPINCSADVSAKNAAISWKSANCFENNESIIPPLVPL